MEDGVFSESSKLADFDETAYFIRETGVDTIAPAIGTAHGLYKGVPHINYELIKRITDELNTPVVIHGGTGLEKEAYKKLVECGAVKINVSTAIKYGYMNGMKEAIDAEGAIEAPLKADDVIFESVKKVAKEHISLFSAK
ncbi:MAG: class II fructose-bisphosphate aldolase, partial [Clostridiales bacterium]|nr:class II fructose-bisphosphate aldolase [Clostridiales bacterium]